MLFREIERRHFAQQPLDQLQQAGLDAEVSRAQQPVGPPVRLDAQVCGLLECGNGRGDTTTAQSPVRGRFQAGGDLLVRPGAGGRKVPRRSVRLDAQGLGQGQVCCLTLDRI